MSSNHTNQNNAAQAAENIEAHERMRPEGVQAGDEQDAFEDFEAQYLTDGNGYAPVSTYKSCGEAFKKAWPDREAAFAAAKAEYDRLHRPAQGARAALASAPVADERQAVAYLDLGAGGYMDVGTDLTDEQLAALPKGRHMLAIIGTHGVNGYTPASAPVAGEAHKAAKPAEERPSDESILDAWDESVTPSTHAYLIDDADKVAFARAVLALAAPQAIPVAGEAVLRIYAEGNMRVVTEWLYGAYDLPDGDYKLYAAPQAPPVAGEALHCRDLTDADMVQIAVWLVQQENGDIGLQGLCDKIITAYAAPQARPSDDDLRDQALKERDHYHDMADQLASAIGAHFGADVGEHSSSHSPWREALEIIDEAAPQASAQDVRNAALEEAYEAVACLYAAYYQQSKLSNVAEPLRALKEAGDYIRALKPPQADKDGAHGGGETGQTGGHLGSDKSPETRTDTGFMGGHLDAHTVVLPPLPEVVLDKLAGPQIVRAEQWARAAVLADRQRRAGDGKEPQ